MLPNTHGAILGVLSASFPTKGRLTTLQLACLIVNSSALESSLDFLSIFLLANK